MLSGSKLWILAMLASSVLSLPTSTAAVGRHDLDKRGKKYVACFTKTEVLPDVVSACDGQWTPEAYPGFYKSGSPYLYIPKAVFDENNACGKWVTISNPIKGGARTGLVVGVEKETDVTCTGATGSATVGLPGIARADGTMQPIDWAQFGLEDGGPVALEYEFIGEFPDPTDLNTAA